jgi:hypothetical protein
MTANTFDGILGSVVQAMRDQVDHLSAMTSGMAPFDSHALTPAEEMLVYQHPASKYPGATDPQSGLPLSNAQAAQRMYTEMGDTAYVAWVTKMAARARDENQPSLLNQAPPAQIGGTDATATASVDATGPDSTSSNPAGY